jgi:hypothetical protein
MDKDKLSEKEKSYIAPCGIFCGACDAYLGKSPKLAKELLRIVDGFNIMDLGPLAFGTDPKKIKTFLNILKKLSRAISCSGCHSGGCWNPMCGVKICTKEKNFLTCAECDTFPCQPSEEDRKKPLENKAAMLELLARRYGNWNIENLKRIKEVGYKKFIEEMLEKVKLGFLTSDVITKEKVLTEAIKEMQKSKETKG